MQKIINPNQEKLYFWKISLVTICACSAIYGLFITKNHYLDDTFTHLRIAKNLMENGFYSFNGINRDYSTSSPLYTKILSFGLRFWDEPYLAKFISIIFYSFVYILTTLFLLKTSNIKSLISTIFLIGISSPLGVRWLTDGMESSLIMLFSIILAYNFKSLNTLNDNPNKAIYYFSAYILCTLSILLRIEFAFIIVWYILVNVLSRIFSEKRLEFKTFFLRFTPIIFSLISSFSILYLNFGSFTPDTSIAKAGVKYDLFYFIYSILRPHFGSSLFGISLALSLLISFYLIYINKDNFKNKSQKNLIYLTYLINLSFPLMLLLILFKGQMIQGIRYFIFIETFLITFNLLICETIVIKKFKIPINNYKLFSYLLIPIIISPWLWNDFKALDRISKGRSETFLSLSSRDFNCLKGKNLMAIDFGMISYFTESRILDPSGLINGREFAKLSMNERLSKFIKNNKIDYAFLNDEQIEDIKEYLVVRDWIIMGKYKFPNFSKNSDDIHYLLKSPEIKKCISKE